MVGGGGGINGCMCMKNYNTYNIVTVVIIHMHVHVGRSWLKCWIMTVPEYQSTSAK